MWKKIIESKYLYLFVNIITLIYSMSFIAHIIFFLYDSYQGYYTNEIYIAQLLSFYSQLIFTLGVVLELRMTMLGHINLKNKSDILNSMVNKNVDITNIKISIIGLFLTILCYAVSVIGLFYMVWVLYLLVGFLTANIIYILIDNIRKK